MRKAIPTTLVIHFLSSLMPIPLIFGWIGVAILTGSDGLNPTWTEHAAFIVHLLLLFLVPVGLCLVALRFVWGRKPVTRGWLSGWRKWWISLSTLIPLVAMIAGWVLCTMVLRDEGFAMLAILAFFPFSVLATWLMYWVFLRPLKRLAV